MRAFLLVVLLLVPALAAAHHVAEPRMRVVLVTERGGDTIVHLRLPAPLIFARALAGRQSPEDRVDAPFLDPVAHRTGWAHYLDASEINADQDGFARLAGRALAIALDGEPVAAAATGAAIHPARALPPFATPADAEAAMASGRLDDDLFVGHGFVHVRLVVGGTGDVSLRSTVDAVDLPDDIFLENIVVDFRADPPAPITQLGAWTDPITLERP